MNKRKTLYFILSILFFIFYPLVTFADSTNSENMKFSMNVVQPENQINKEVTYLDLLVKPGAKQKIEVVVTNTGKGTKNIRVTPTNAITNARGLVDYSIKEKNYEYDATLTTPFSTLISEAQTVEVKPGESKSVFFDLKAPDTDFKGIILGGFVADLPEEDTSTKTDESITFVNKFQMVKGIMIRTSESEIIPDIKLNDVKPALYTNRTAVTANLQNTSPILLGDVQVDAEIIKKGDTDILKSESRSDVQFAPNSNFDFPIMWDNDSLEPGDYTLKIKIVAQKKETAYTQEFRITKTDSTTLNNAAVDLNETDSDYILWIILAIVLVVIIIILIIFVIFLLKKSKRKQHSKSKKSNKLSSKNRSKKKNRKK